MYYIEIFMYTQSYIDITDITIYTYYYCYYYHYYYYDYYIYYMYIYYICPTILLLGDLPTGVLEHLRHGQHFILKLSSCVFKLPSCILELEF